MGILKDVISGFVDSWKVSKIKPQTNVGIATKFNEVTKVNVENNLNKAATLGSILYEQRKKKNLKQYEVSKALNLSSNALSKYENGVCFPSKETLIKLLDFYDFQINYISIKELDTICLYENFQLIYRHKYISPYATEAAENGYFIVADFDYKNKLNYFYVLDKNGKIIIKDTSDKGPLEINIDKQGKIASYKTCTEEQHSFEIS